MDGSPATILIVDDLPANRLVLERQIERLGHRGLSVENGQRALEALRVERIDMVLLDIMMPVMNGFETLEVMKGDPSLAHIPVVVVSALNDVENVARCISLGAEDFLFKPVDRVLLEARIESCLSRKRLHDREQAAHAAAEAANAAKGRFVSLVAHELKSPITALIGYTDLLTHSGEQPPTPFQQEHLLRMRKLGTLLATLIDDLSDLSRIESGHLQLSPRPLALAAAARAAVAALEGELKARRQRLRVEIPADLPLVWGDDIRLNQILLNLLGNASKYTPDEGEITVVAVRRDAAVEVTVRDTGVGISPADAPHIFEPFYRARSAAVTRQPGSGLGLSITRHLVELQGGRIWFTSEPGVGSAFTFSILMLPADLTRGAVDAAWPADLTLR